MYMYMLWVQYTVYMRTVFISASTIELTLYLPGNSQIDLKRVLCVQCVNDVKKWTYCNAGFVNLKTKL